VTDEHLKKKGRRHGPVIVDRPSHYTAEERRALKRVLDCPDLHLEELEEETRHAIELGWETIRLATEDA